MVITHGLLALMSAEVTLIPGRAVVVAASATWDTLGLGTVTVVAVPSVRVQAVGHVTLAIVQVTLGTGGTATLMGTATGRVGAWAVGTV